MTIPAGAQRSFLDAAQVVLAEAQGPLGAEEITARALERGLVRTAGKTPAATMAARLYQDINRLGSQSRFVKVSAGQFALRLDTSRTGASPQDRDARRQSGTSSSVVAIAASPVDALVRELLTAQTDSKNPARFEQSVRDAFDALGFDATRLGGSGETDVYLVARAGAELYRVVVDAKSSGNARVTEGQINWVSVRDHRTHRDAHHVLVVAPGFAAGNLLTRASEYQVALLQAQDLAEVVRWHAETPFSLLELRPLFEGPGHVTQALADLKRLHETTARQWSLLPEIIEAYAELGDVHPDVAGVYLYLRGRQSAKTLWRETVEHAIGMLASPLLGILRPHHSGGGYALTMRPETAHRRLRAMTRAAAGAEEPVAVADGPPSVPPPSPPASSPAPLDSTNPLVPQFEAVQKDVLARLSAHGYREDSRRAPHMVVLKRRGERVVVSFRASRFYPDQKKWWWTFHDRVEGIAGREVGPVVLVGLMAGEGADEALRDTVTWIGWELAISRVADTTAWTRDRKVQVEVYRTGRGRWGDRIIRIDDLPDPLARD